MRRVLFVAIGAFFLAAALLPTQSTFVVRRRVRWRTPGDVSASRPWFASLTAPSADLAATAWLPAANL